MIIWINGAFGSGKTQTSLELRRRLASSFIFDPENAGYYIRKNLPREASRDDFQDYSMWREFNYSMLKYISGQYPGIIIVPMTVVQPLYFEEVVGSLRNDGITVHHFTLCASKETLLRRLRSRGNGPNSWAAQQIDRCVDGLSNDIFRHHLDTESLNIGAVADKIASMLNLTLQPDTRGKLRRALDRWLTLGK